jgi:sarcosine oxidase gamma subunit
VKIMTAAALKTETFVGGSIAGGASKSGTGVVEGIYTVTIVTTKDWVVLDEFDEILYVHAFVDSDGTDAEAYIDGSTTNKVYITGTGACTLLVKGTPATE